MTYPQPLLDPYECQLLTLGVTVVWAAAATVTAMTATTSQCLNPTAVSTNAHRLDPPPPRTGGNKEGAYKEEGCGAVLTGASAVGCRVSQRTLSPSAAAWDRRPKPQHQ